MFDQRKQQQLENRSHVRGKLNKEFFSTEQEQLERKRREMKQILDQQVEERRRQKQKQKHEQQRALQEEDQKMKAYYAQVDEREMRYSIAQPSSNRNGSGIYESKVSYGERDPNNPSNDAHYGHTKNSRNNVYSDLGNIPVMSVMQGSDKLPATNTLNPHSFSPPHRSSVENMGNIPLLELTQDEIKKQNRKKSKSKYPLKKEPRQRDIEREEQKNREKGRRQQKGAKQSLNPRDIRNVGYQQSLPASRQPTEFKDMFEDINEEIQQENKELRKQLKKNQEAISLLIGAVKSSSKLDKFRVQAQRILYGQNSVPTKGESRVKKSSTRSNEKDKDFMLPQLKMRHQSIMHDYMFGSARKANVLKSKTAK